MKKFYVLITLSIVFLNTSGQAMLGSMASEIKKEYTDPKYKLETGFDDDGDLFLSVVTDRAIVYYFFKSADKPCYITAIYPITQGDLNYFVEMYNKSFVIISETSWKKYTNSGYANIYLQFNGEHSCFVWRLPLEN